MAEDDEKLTHGGGEGELLGFAGGDRAPLEGAQSRVVAGRDQAGHVEHRAHVGGKNSAVVLRYSAFVTSRS